MARANGGLSNHVKDTCRSQAHRNPLIKAQLSALNVATGRGTSDKSHKTEATRFSQCVHDQRRSLGAEDCDGIRCAQLISSGRRRIRYMPITLPRSRSPHNVLHSPSNYWASVSEPHTCDFNATFSLYIDICYNYIYMRLSLYF